LEELRQRNGLSGFDHGGGSGAGPPGVAPQKKSDRAAAQDRPDVKARRHGFRRKRAAIAIRRFVAYDESSAKTNVTRFYGRTFDGQRLVEAVPGGHWRTTTMLASLRVDGTTAAMSLEGAVDRRAFEAYVEQVLLPTLKPGDIFLLDNLNVHKSARVVSLLESVGAHVWFLPPYSPDLNPIEGMWSKAKAVLRKIKPRTPHDLDNAIGTARRCRRMVQPLRVCLHSSVNCSNRSLQNPILIVTY
jgi:transposase